MEKRLAHSCGLEAGRYTIFSLFLYNYNNSSPRQSTTLSFSSHSSFLEASQAKPSHKQASTHCVRLLHLGSFFLFFFFFFLHVLKKNKRSKRDNTCFYHTYNSVKLAQPMSNTSTPWPMLSMETLALLKSNNKSLVNTRRNQTYCPSQLLTKAVLESIQQAAPGRTVFQTV